jgi:hypothetical protein
MIHAVVYFKGTHVTVWGAKDTSQAIETAERAMNREALAIDELGEGQETPQGFVIDLRDDA